MVFEAGMSSPDSTIAVETRMSACPGTNFHIVAASARSFIWPWPMMTRASGTSSWTKRAIVGRDWTRLWTKKTCPPRSSSRSSASLITPRPKRRGAGPAGGPGRGGGRRRDHRHVAHAGERHVEGARDRRRREREHVHRGAQLLHPLLVRDAEAVLLVHHEQPQALELHVLGQEPVRPDDDVHGPHAEPLDDRLLLAGRAEAREQLDARGGGREPVGEGRPGVL